MATLAEIQQNSPNWSVINNIKNNVLPWIDSNDPCYAIESAALCTIKFPTNKSRNPKIKNVSKLKNLLLPVDWENPTGYTLTFKTPHARDINKSLGTNVVSSMLIKDFNDDIEITFEDERFILPKELKHIADEIQDSKDILNLEDNWNDEGAIAVPREILLRAVNLVVSYSKWILENLGLVIESPLINPLPDGSIDLKWQTRKARLLINTRNNDKMEAYYYGDFFNDENATKGRINTNGVIDFFAYWMANLRN